MNISVIIVSWNVKEHLRSCLQSIKKHTKDIDYEVIVVDNASQDGSAEMVEHEFPWVKLIPSNENLGFGKANNHGAEIARGEVIFFLNDDTILTENSLLKVYKKVKLDETIGVLGFHITNQDGSHQDSVRRYPKLGDQLMILLKLHRLLPRCKALRRYLAQDMDYTREQDVDQVMGACMVLRKEIFNSIGRFDEHFFVWFEEVDLQKRIQDELHLRIVYSPLTEMIHVQGASFGKVLSVTNQRRFIRSMEYYFKKHYGPLHAWILKMFAPLSIALAFGAQIYKAIK